MSIRVATDVGGTFTDLVYIDEDGALRATKASTTPGAFSRGLLNAVEKSGIDLAEAAFFAHGSTVVINAITERRGARTALVTTRGFRDVLEIGRGNRPDMYNLRPRKPAPFVPRRLRFEVTERIDHHGAELTPVALDELDAVVAACRTGGIEALAVCLVNSFANPAHEIAVRDHIAAALPELEITVSSDITRQLREYERSSTAVLNAYVQPVVNSYLGELEEGLRDRERLACRPVAMQSNGGTASFSRARRAPINLVESGPAAGIIGAARIGEALGEPNVIYLDIGGTTAKCSLIEDGVPKTTSEYKLERDQHNAGYPVLVPVVDIVEIGAGGGSIAWVDEGGALHVGPQSAGAEPGPACYGRGGTQPTVTDAKLVAGVLNADYFLGGDLDVDIEASRAALRGLGAKLGLTAEQTANGIIRLVNANMINALKLVSVRRGYDPRDFVLVACGGGGAMHAAALGAELRVKHVVIPPLPGTFSAWGMLVTEPRVDLMRTRIVRTDDHALERVREVFGDLERESADAFDEQEAMAGELRFTRAVEMRYHGQEHTVTVPLGEKVGGLEELEAAFHREHQRAYTFALDDTPIEIVNFHLTAHRSVDVPRSVNGASTNGVPPEKASRHVDFDVHGVHECRVFERGLLPAGFEQAGPALIEEPTSTTLVHPGQRVRVDDHGNLVITGR
jgi:N-methylhydantoinase A